jgi:hypothetical protein
VRSGDSDGGCEPVRPVEVSDERKSEVGSQMGDEDCGERVPMKAMDPKLPSPAEEAEHMLTHLPYRSWCVHCVRGKGKSTDHRKSRGDERGVREIHLDYCFLGGAEDDKTNTVLIAKDRDSKMVMASVVPVKGSSHQFPARRVRAFLNELGYEGVDVTIKTDQEPAIKDLVNEVVKLRSTARTMKEESPFGSSASNGVIERGVQTVEGQIRVIKNALEERLNIKIPGTHNILSWMVEFAGVLVNRYEVGKDGRTPYERSRGKKSKLLGLEFGEKLNFRRTRAPGRLAKLECLWEDGVFLGYRSASGETIVGTNKGVFRTRTVQRKPYEQRWSSENLDMVAGTPWKTSGEQDKENDEGVMPEIVVRMEVPEAMKIDRPEANASEYVPRRVYLRSKEFDEHGFTPGCGGCNAMMKGEKKSIHHSEECRKRMNEAMGKTEVGRKRLEEAERRGDKYLEELGERITEHEAHAKRPRVETSASSGSPALPSSSSAPAANQQDDMEWEEFQRRLKQRAGERAEGEPEAKRAAKEDSEGVKENPKETEMEIDELDVNIEDDVWNELEMYEAEGGLGADGALDPEGVARARDEEISYMRRITVWEESTLEECIRMTGKSPVSTRWVDVDKGRQGVPDIRSRLCARDFKVRGDGREFDVFASMPPLEAKRMLFRMAVADGAIRKDRKKGKVKLMFIDVKKAHLNGKLKDDEFAYVQLPPEAGGGVARLRRWLYGMRPAAQAWERAYTEKLTGEGFVRGSASSVVFVNPETEVRCVVWGDDFTFLGREGDLKHMEKVMSEWYEVKVRGIVGPDPHDLSEIRILNRTLRWKQEGIELEADSKHVKTIIDEVGLKADSKGSDSPLPKDFCATDGDVALGGQQAHAYRRIAALVNYLALDRIDLQFSAGVLGRTASRPTERSWTNLKRVARYLVKHPRVVYKFYYCGVEEALTLVGYSDSDWAGCKDSRRSVSGGVVLSAGALLKSWSNRQATVALSSAEAELYAASKTAAELMGIESLFVDMGWKPTVVPELYTDSNAAKAIASRRGLSRTRHLEVRKIWIQSAIEDKRIKIKKVAGTENPADPLTKLKSFQDFLAVTMSRAGVAERA